MQASVTGDQGDMKVKLGDWQAAYGTAAKSDSVLPCCSNIPLTMLGELQCALCMYVLYGYAIA